MNEEWTRETPEVPTRKPSTFIWYWDEKDPEPTVMELWPNRSVAHKKGFWGLVIVPAPRTNPIKGEGIKVDPPQIEFKGDGLLTGK